MEDEHLEQAQLEAATMALAARDLDTALRVLARGARQALAARYAGLVLWSIRSRRLLRWVPSGPSPEEERDLGPPSPEWGLLYETATAGRPLVVTEPAHDPRSGGAPSSHPPLHSFLGAPVHISPHLDIFGALYAMNKEGPGFTQRDERTLSLLARLAGVLLERFYTDQRLWEAYMEVLEGWGRAFFLYLDLPSQRYDHLLALARALLHRLGTKEEVRETMARSVLLQGVGFFFLPRHLLDPRKPRSPEEERRRRLHTLYGARLFERTHHHLAAHDAALYHHEHWNGSGYPEGLAGEDIPFAGRLGQVMGVVSTYLRWGEGETLRSLAEEVASQGGRQADPAMARAFWELWEEGDLVRLLPATV